MSVAPRTGSVVIDVDDNADYSAGAALIGMDEEHEGGRSAKVGATGASMGEEMTDGEGSDGESSGGEATGEGSCSSSSDSGASIASPSSSDGESANEDGSAEEGSD